MLDAGSKVLTSDQYYVQNHSHILEYPEVVIPSLSEEHAVVDLLHCPDRPSVGDVVNVVPQPLLRGQHMVDEVHGTRGDRVEVTWPVAARGAVR